MLWVPRRRGIVLFNAGQQLLAQLVALVQKGDDFSVRSVSSQCASTVVAAEDGGVAGIIDATTEPAVAMDTLETVLERFGPGGLAVYTQVMHDGLELFVRVRGVLLLLGPMDPTEWYGVLLSLVSAADRPGE